ncbi:MAG: hypothetical protein QM756_03240 [Polyangiaceae bacterium]
MSRLNTSRTISLSLPIAAAALFLIHCSPASEAPGGQGGSQAKGGSTTTGNGGGTVVNGGTTTSSNGGASTGNGGTTSTGNGGASTGNGGTTSTGSGGASTGNGGTTSTGNGGTTTTGTGGTTTTASGGSTTTSTCGAYTGAVAKDSTIFKDGFGTSTTGGWVGYAFTFPYMGGGTITPDTSKGTSCFKGAQMCANGTVPASYTAGAAIGWNIGQAQGATTSTPVTLTGSIKVTVAGAVAGMRVSLAVPTGENYCYTLTATDVTTIASGLSLPVTSFKQLCYDATKAVAYTSAMIKAIQVEVPGDMAGAKSFDFCLIDVEPG